MTLKVVIGKLVWNFQSAFVKGRSIFEGWSVVAEMIEVVRRAGDGCVFKIDSSRKLMIAWIKIF